jgi:alanine-glyoxylate transaminase/serine-glyoxylate transaminase/serine-pyruvate transaminase
MSNPRPLLMIPGPVEISPAVREAFGGPPPGHLAPRVIDAFGASLQMMRRVWQAADSSQPFVVAGGGTVAMDMAAANLIEPGERALVVNTGFFSERLAEMLRRQAAEVIEVGAAVGEAPTAEAVRDALDADGGPCKALFATHVDTSTGVRLDPRPLAALARERGLLAVFDGVCATAAEPFDMEGWGADVYLTGSQKAIGLPPGLALMVVSGRALEVRDARLATAPPMYLDWREWLPVMRAYEARKPAYFSTPATNLVLALEVGLEEILERGIQGRVALHDRVGRAMRAAWRSMGLSLVPARDELAANTLSAVKLPRGVDPSLIGEILEQGVIVAGGLHPAIRNSYFRVGHMGYAATQPEMLYRTLTAIGVALRARGVAVDPDSAVAAARAVLADDAAS